MMHQTATQVTVVLLLIAVSRAQRVAPGVPPQHYQQVPGQQQYQQQHHPQQQHQQQQPPQQQQYQQQQQMHVPPGVAPQQYQGQVQYQQQPPPQQQQQQMPVQQQQQYQQPPHVQQIPQGQPQQHHVPHQQQHGHPQQVLNAGNLDHERAHIQEHMRVPIDTSKMSEAELQFHYFKMHDSDNNNKLDGCELIKSLIHWHEQGSKESHDEQKPHVEEKVFSDEELVALIDPILQMDDTSRDGYIDYPEFIKAQQKAAASQAQQQAQQQPQQPGQ